MESKTAMECFASAIKVDGQIDLLLSLLAKLSTLKKSGELSSDVQESIRRVIIAGMMLVKNETELAHKKTEQEEFISILACLEEAIRLAEHDDYYAAGNILTDLASNPQILIQRARGILEGQRTQWIF